MAIDTRPPQKFPRSVTAFEAVRLVTGWLRQRLAAPTERTDLLATLLLQLSAQRSSFQAAARRGPHLPSPSLLGKWWRQWRQTHTLPEWEAAFTERLPAPWREALRGEPVWFVADWHSIPYWGEVPPALRSEVRRGPAQRGTTHFFVYASVAVLWRGVRIQLACTRVGAAESQAAVFERLLTQVQALGCRVLGWLLDKGFYAAGVVAALRAQELPYLIAAPRRGPKHGIAAILDQAEHDYGFQEQRPPDMRLPYTLTAMDPAVASQATEVIVGWEPVQAPPAKRRQRTLRRSKIRPGQRWRAVAWIGGGRQWTGKKAQRVYPRRTSVESGYRQSEWSRGRTSSRDPAWRFCLFAMSLLLQNGWVWLLIQGQRTRQRWWKRCRDRLPFIDFCGWIAHLLAQETGFCLAVDLPGV